MVISLLLVVATPVGCLSDNPPADCPADCREGDARAACQMDTAVKRQMNEAWKASDGLAKHSMMAKKTGAKRPKVKTVTKAPQKSLGLPWRRCSLGIAWAGAGLWLVTEKNWLARSVGAISALAGLWVCASAR